MVSVYQVQQGAARYVEEEFVNKLTGWQKWVFAAGITRMLQVLPQKFSELKASPMVGMLGLIDSADNIDIDAAYELIKAEARKSAVTFEVPLIGAVTLNETDVDKIYSFIVNSR